jgi:hypothetical protein
MIIALIVSLASALAEPSSPRSFYDSNGSFAGSSMTRGNSTSPDPILVANQPAQMYSSVNRSS